MKTQPNIQLKVALMKQGLTQRDLAFGSNIDESRISKIIKGYEAPTVEMKQAIADYLGIEMEQLF